MKRKMTKQEKREMKFYNFEDLLAKDMKNPAFKKAWEANEPYYQMVSALIDARNRGEITQKELARMLKTKQSAVSRFESGKVKNPTMSFLHKMATALGMRLILKFEVLSKKV